MGSKPGLLALPGDGDLLDVKEAAAYLHYKPQTVYNLVNQGELPHYKPRGGRLLFMRGELRAWVMRFRSSANYELEEEAEAILGTAGRKRT